MANGHKVNPATKSACRVCNHPERAQIELAIANARPGTRHSVMAVATKWGIAKSSVYRHRDHHMSQQDIMRLRMGMPDAVDEAIEEVVRREGEGAILSLRDLKLRFLTRADLLEQNKDFEGSRKELAEAAKVSRDLVLYAGLVPGRKTVTNNNLVLGDVSVLFDVVDAALRAFPEARRAVAAAWAKQANPPALEHAA